ncbi:MAG: hypothetical protein K2F91_01840, partial [Muribaculaceae bacterium]|nr:hypothetical protein [Muribaculaceae bacterium]
ADQYKLTDMLIRIPLKGSAYLFALMVSLMKLGRGDEAEAVYEQARPMIETILDDAPMPIKMSARCLMTLRDKIRRHPASEKLYWEYFDMLSYGKFK